MDSLDDLILLTNYDLSAYDLKETYVESYTAESLTPPTVVQTKVLRGRRVR